MNYYGSQDLAAGFRTVRKNTITVAEEIPEESYNFRAAPETRTVGQTLVHLALTPTFSELIHGQDRLTTFEGFDFKSHMQRMHAEIEKPRTKAQILSLLGENGNRFAAWLEMLSDDFLAERVSSPAGGIPPSKTRFEMLLGVKEHEMHHRGQLMLIERMLGIVPHLTRQFQERMAAREQQSATGSARA
jgi:uncharacterized damage-inducible protein DinB